MGKKCQETVSLTKNGIGLTVNLELDLGCDWLRTETIVCLADVVTGVVPAHRETAVIGCYMLPPPPPVLNIGSRKRCYRINIIQEYSKKTKLFSVGVYGNTGQVPCWLIYVKCQTATQKEKRLITEREGRSH